MAKKDIPLSSKEGPLSSSEEPSSSSEEPSSSSEEPSSSSEEPSSSSEEPSPSSEEPPSFPLRTRLALKFLHLFFTAAHRSDGTVNRWLLPFLDPYIPTYAASGVSSRNVDIGPYRDLWFRLFFPSFSSNALPVFVFFHGGGFLLSSPASLPYDAYCRRLARKLPAIVVSVNYRLSPESRCPAQYDDGLKVLNWLDENFDGLLVGGDLSRCFLVGDSAGGNIAHHVARRWRGGKRVRVVGMVALQPFFGGEGRVESETRAGWKPLLTTKVTDWMWRAFLPEGEDRDHWAANVFGPRSEGELGEAFPPAMVAIGELDLLEGWQKEYVNGLKERGKEVVVVEYKYAFHAFYLFSELEESSLLMVELKAFVERCCTEEDDDGETK